MLIIVEGIDRVGKTTLCNKIKCELGLPIYKHCGEFDYSKMDNDNETDKMLQMLEICSLSNSNIIFDRFHISDFVYGTLERKYDIVKANENFEKIDCKVSSFEDVCLLYILPTDIKRSSVEHGKDLDNHNETFYDLYKRSKIKNKFRCTYNTLDEAITFIKSIRRE